MIVYCGRNHGSFSSEEEEEWGGRITDNNNSLIFSNRVVSFREEGKKEKKEEGLGEGKYDCAHYYYCYSTIPISILLWTDRPS